MIDDLLNKILINIQVLLINVWKYNIQVHHISEQQILLEISTIILCSLYS